METMIFLFCMIDGGNTGRDTEKNLLGMMGDEESEEKVKETDGRGVA